MKTVFIKTFGCTLNKRDSFDIVSGQKIAKTEKEADIIIVNTCGVKEQTEFKIYKYLKDKQNDFKKKEIIICGCLVNINSENLKKISPTANFFKIEDKKKLIDYLKKNKTEKEKQNNIVIISNGCLGNCAYCAVKFARGKLKSKSVSEIIKEIESTDSKEILLTSQDSSCYGLDINTNLVELLEEIIKHNKDIKIRVGMANPRHLGLMKKEIVEIFKSEKIYKFLHIPVQSGNNRILKLMNRTYTREEYLELIKYFKKNIKNLTLATDIILGFPTETDVEFLDTLDLIKKCEFDIVNISRFGQRKNIEANKYKDLSGTLKKERSRISSKLCLEIALENNKKQIGKTKEILITEIGKNKTMLGRTQEYKQVVVSGKYNIGDKIKVKITDAKPGYLLSSLK